MSPARLIAYAALALVAAYLLAVGVTRMREGRCEYAQGWYARGKGHLDCSKPHRCNIRCSIRSKNNRSVR